MKMKPSSATLLPRINSSIAAARCKPYPEKWRERVMRDVQQSSSNSDVTQQSQSLRHRARSRALFRQLDGTRQHHERNSWTAARQTLAHWHIPDSRMSTAVFRACILHHKQHKHLPNDRGTSTPPPPQRARDRPPPPPTYPLPRGHPLPHVKHQRLVTPHRKRRASTSQQRIGRRITAAACQCDCKRVVPAQRNQHDRWMGDRRTLEHTLRNS